MISMSIDPHRILFSDNHLLVVSKLSGELVVKGKGKVGKLPLLDFLKKEYPGLQTIHRLDFETSGTVSFARNKIVAQKIRESRFTGWQKNYLTLVKGMPKKKGVIRLPLPTRRNPKSKNSKQIFVEAVTKYSVIESFGDVSLVECEIETGRHHQIRRHFAMLGHPLVLDEEYGDRKFNRLFVREYGFRKFFLHAKALEFPHPMTGKKIHIEALLPKAFEQMLQRLYDAVV